MPPISFKCHRCPPEIIQHAVWLYAQFTLSFRNAEDLLAERGIDVSNETVRRWFLKFGRLIEGNLRRSLPLASARWQASRRDGHQNPWPETLAVARSRRRRRSARLPGPATTLRQVREAIAPKAAQEAGLRAEAHHHR